LEFRPPARSTRNRIARYVLLALILAALGAGASGAVGSLLGNRYSATSQVLVRAPLSAQTVVTGNPGAQEDLQRVVDTDLQIAQSRDFLSRVSARLNSGELSTDALTHDLTIATTGDADLLAFTAAEPNAQSALAVANAAADEFVTYIKSLSAVDVGTSNSQDPLVKEAQSRLQLLQRLAPAATIVSSASSATQIRPNHSRDALVGLTAGLMVAVVGIAFRETVVNRRRDNAAAAGSV
jgi:capsular polysaccharide biosynthesis protein